MRDGYGWYFALINSDISESDVFIGLSCDFAIIYRPTPHFKFMLANTAARLSSTSNSRPETAASIAFDISKKELFTLSAGYKGLQKRLRATCKISLYKDEMNLAKLSEYKLLVFSAPCEKFSTTEFAALKAYLAQGGNILYLANEGGEGSCDTNFNYLLEEFGMMVNPGLRALM